MGAASGPLPCMGVILLSAGLCLSCTTPPDQGPSAKDTAPRISVWSPSSSSTNLTERARRPRISVSLLPELPKVGDTFRTVAEPLNPESHLFLDYQWLINDQEVEGAKGDSFTGRVRRGDKVSVRVTPSDGVNTGLPVTVSRHVLNSPPLVHSLSAPGFDGAQYQTRLEASDPDGDPLEFTILEGPGGISIDDQGWIRWHTGGTNSGMHVVVASVKDGQGGEIVYSYRFTVGRSQGTPPQD